jgi:hypothetical protein
MTCPSPDFAPAAVRGATFRAAHSGDLVSCNQTLTDRQQAGKRRSADLDRAVIPT